MNIEVDPETIDQRLTHYRAICSSAIVSLVLGFLSLLAIISPKLLIIPLLGTIVGTAAWHKIRNRALELTGKPLAITGLSLSSVLLIGCSTLHIYIFLTEVPDGYQRISFFDLQPEPGALDPVPESAVALNGKQIFIKGYVYPGDQRRALKQFVFVPDMGTCCFGGQPKLTDMIEVTLKDPNRVDFSYRKRRLGGILRVDPQLKPISGLQGVYYQLEADYLN